MPRVVWAEESKTGLELEIGPQQQKLCRRPNVQLIGNPASFIHDYLLAQRGARGLHMAVPEICFLCIPQNLIIFLFNDNI